MSEMGESIIRGLQDIIDFQNGDKSKGRVKIVKMRDIEPIEEYSKEKIKEFRQEKQFTQKDFAELFGVSKKTIEAWEMGTRKPTGTAKRLFQIMEKEPTVMNIIVRQGNEQIHARS